MQQNFYSRTQKAYTIMETKKINSGREWGWGAEEANKVILGVSWCSFIACDRKLKSRLSSWWPTDYTWPVRG